MDAAAHGRVKTIALYGTSSRRFVQMVYGGNVGLLSDEVSPEEMAGDAGRTWERFQVVDAGAEGGERLVGLYCAAHRRFLRMTSNGKVDGGDQPRDVGEPLSRWERFRWKDEKDDRVAVYCPAARRFLRLCGGKVNGGGGVCDYDQLPGPTEWDSERFLAVPCDSSNLMGAVAVNGSCPSEWIPTNPSEMEVPVTFSVAFDRCPSVHVALSMIDCDQSANLRLNCKVTDITTTGCVINVWSWADSKVWGCHLSWFASDDRRGFQCGSVCDDVHLCSKGSLEKEVRVNFDRPFTDIPTVAVALKKIDVCRSHNARVAVKVKEGSVTRDGFVLVRTTWSDTVVHGVDVAWLATSSSKMRVVAFAEPDGFYAPLQNGDDKRRRTVEKELNFEPPFSSGVWAVPMGLTLLDTGCGRNVRVQCHVLSAARSTVKVAMTSWDDSITYRANAVVIGAQCSADRQYVEERCSNPAVSLPEDFVLDGDFRRARLGSGAHGQTFRVRNIHDEQVYCLKQFFNSSNPSILREIRNLAQLPHHVNIVRYYSTRRLNDQYFLQLELINGRTLAASICHGLDADAFQHQGRSQRVCSWARQLYDGLAHLHTKMFHRDLHPDNILVVAPAAGFEHGLIKIIDMGNARQATAEGNFSLRHEGATKYFSPERRTEHANWGAKDDVWAVACIAAELTVGKCITDRDFGLPENTPSIRARENLIREVGHFCQTRCYRVVHEVLTELYPHSRKTAEEMVGFIDRLPR